VPISRWRSIAVVLATLACSDPPTATVVARYPLDSHDGTLAPASVIVDETITSDGNGSLRVYTTEPLVVPLLDLGDVDAEGGFLICDAHLRVEDVEGPVYLELICNFPGRGEYFSRGLRDAVTRGGDGWVRSQVSFFLREGENPSGARLNLVITAPGTAWVDDVRVITTREE